MFITLGPEACVIKLITAVIYGFRIKPFQPSLVFSDKHSSLLRKP